MKKIYLLLFVFFLSLAVTAQQGDKCGTQDWLEAQFKANPGLRAQYERDEKKLGEVITSKLANQGNSTEVFTPPVTIPVVFHVVLTAAQHALLTDQMIMDQFNVLNNDFTGFNADSSNIPPAFQAVRGHASFSFVMAKRTPAGLATNGIVRVVSTRLSTGSGPATDPIKSDATQGSSAWDPNNYVNVWLCNFTSPSLLGYATFPIGSPEGNNNLSQQGVVVLAQTVPGGSVNPYNEGRTLTHELGHFFWLRHITGDSPCGNDFPNTPGIDDTPQQLDLTGGCPGQAPNINFLASGCAASPNPPGRMYQNFMDYTNDLCMTMFTKGQITRAEAAITTYRPTLLTSQGGVPPSGFTFGAITPTTVACPAPATASATLTTTASGGFNTPIVLTATAGVPAGTTVTFAPSPVAPGSSTTVTLNNANTLSNGTYNITVTGVAGTSTQTATVSFVISAGTAPTVAALPTTTTVCAPAAATFSSSVSGATATGYQWQLNSGSGFANIAGATSANYTTAATTAAMNGYQYRVLVTGQCGTSTSNASALAVNTAPAIATADQPKNTTVCAGNNASFTVVATGAGLSYVWEQSTNGGGAWAAAPGANTAATYTVTGVTLPQSGYQYRVVVTGTCAPALTSSVATLTVGNEAQITGQPQNQIVCVGSPVSFSVTATGSSLTYQWQVNAGAAWADVPGATSAALNIPGASVLAGMNGYKYRVNVFSCTTTPIVSNEATLTVNVLSAITAQPAASVICAGTGTSFTTTAVGTNATYQWQVSTTGCAGTFANVTNTGVYSGATTATLSLTAPTAALNGYAYRVVVTNSCNTVTSDCVLLTVNSPIAVTTQPVSGSVCLPTTTTSFNVVVTGTAPTYQWQLSTNSGTSWANITGATTATLSLTGLTAAMSGYQYRVVISGTCTAAFNSSVATLVVNSPVSITDNPDDVSICEGANTSFSVAATGSTITYQWQVRKNGGPFANVTNAAPYSGATTATLAVTGATTVLSGNEYRVVVSGVPCGSVNSDTASLTVNANPAVVLVAAPYNNLTPSTPSGLFSTVSPAGTYSYVWRRDGSIVTTATSSSLPVNVDGFGEYDVTVRDQNGCSSASNRVTISDSVNSLIFIYPNPSNGVFQVRYYSASTTDFTLNVTDSRGGRVWSKKYPVTARYEQMLVDLGRNASGVYKVEIRGRDGKRLAAGNVLIKR